MHDGKCPECGKPSGRDNRHRPMRLCGRDTCKRADAARKSREYRARQKAVMAGLAPAPAVVDPSEIRQEGWDWLAPNGGRYYPDADAWRTLDLLFWDTYYDCSV